MTAKNNKDRSTRSSPKIILNRDWLPSWWILNPLVNPLSVACLGIASSACEQGYIPVTGHPGSVSQSQRGTIVISPPTTPYFLRVVYLARGQEPRSPKDGNAPDTIWANRLAEPAAHPTSLSTCLSVPRLSCSHPHLALLPRNLSFSTSLSLLYVSSVIDLLSHCAPRAICVYIRPQISPTIANLPPSPKVFFVPQRTKKKVVSL